MIINELLNEDPQVGDSIDLEFGDLLVETTITDIRDDGVVVDLDAVALGLILESRKTYLKEGVAEDIPGFSQTPSEWKQTSLSYEEACTKFGKENCKIQGKNRLGEPIVMVRPESKQGVAEAKYQGREVPLGKPMKGDVKKSKVYVKGPKGNVVKVNFGDKNMRIKKSNPGRRKSFRARHNCSNPGPRWKARYWSCRAW